HDAEVSDIEDRGLAVLVDRDDRLRRLHPGLVLDRTGDAQCHIQLRRHGHTGLADLMRLGDVPGIDGRTRSTESGPEDIGELADEFEGLLRTDAATTGDDRLRTTVRRTPPNRRRDHRRRPSAHHAARAARRSRRWPRTNRSTPQAYRNR